MENIKPLSNSELEDFTQLMTHLRLNTLEEEDNIKTDLDEEDDVHYQRRTITNLNRGAGLIYTNLKNAEETHAAKMKVEGINPFEVYLNLDCRNDLESIIDQWKKSLKVAININKWVLQDTIRFIEMTLLGKTAKHWKAQTEADKSVIIMGNDIGTIISRFVLGFKHEFLGEGYQSTR